MEKKRLWGYLLGAAVLILLIKYSDHILNGGRLLLSILMPLFLGCAIAYVLNILVARLERLPFFQTPGTRRYRCRRAFGVVGALVIILAVIALLVRIIIPQLLEAFGVVVLGIQPMLEKLSAWIAAQELPLPQIRQWVESLQINWPELVQKAATYLSNGVGNLLSGVVSLVSSIGGAVFQFVIALIFALYLLAGKERLKGQVKSLAETYLPERARRRMFHVFQTADDVFSRFIVGQCTEAVILGVLCTLGMLLFRFPYATMIGTLVGALALLPIVGAYLAAALGAFMILTVNPLQAVGFLIFLVILQQLEGNLIYPRVVGSSVGLPGIWVLAAVTVGGGLGGIVGMLLAVPTAATVYRLLKQDVARRRSAGQEVPKEQETSENMTKLKIQQESEK